jgi:heterodisulfide reductase subunit A
MDASGAKKESQADMVILCPAIIAPRDNEKLAGMMSLDLDGNGFFKELQAKSAPVSTNIKGVFVAGCAQGPKDIPSSIAQGASAAGHLLATLVPGRKLELESITTLVDEEVCGRCLICVSLCPFNAIRYDEGRRTAVVNEVLCMGCGICVAACPSGSAKGRHFTTEQIFAEIEGVLA